MARFSALAATAAAALLLLATAPTHVDASCPPGENLVHVGVRTIPPFVEAVCEDSAALTTAGGQTLCHTGYTIQLWTDWYRPQFTDSPDCVRWHLFTSNDAGIAAVANGETVVFLAGTTVNEERRGVVDFHIIDSDGSITLLTDGTTDTGGTAGKSFEILLSPFFWGGLALAVASVLLLGAQTWGIDQLSNEKVNLTFPATFVKGVLAATATAINVILGDPMYRPSSAPSKAWKFVLRAIHIVAIAAVTGLFVNLLSTASVVFTIESFEDTAGRRVGTLAGNTPESFMSHNYPAAQIIPYDSFEDMTAGFVAGNTEALAYDTTYLVWLWRNGGPDFLGTRIINERVAPYVVGIAYAKNDDIVREKLTAGILGAYSAGAMVELRERFLSASDADTEASSGTATIFTVVLWLAIFAPAVLLLVVMVSLKRMRALTKGKLGTAQLLKLQIHRFKQDQVWKDTRTKYMDQDACKMEDARVETSYASIDSIGPATLNAVKEVRYHVRKIGKKIGSEAADSDDDAAARSVGDYVPSPTAAGAGAGFYSITPAHPHRAVPVMTLPSAPDAFRMVIFIKAVEDLADFSLGDQGGWMEWRGVPTPITHNVGDESTSTLSVPVAHTELTSASVKFVITNAAAQPVWVSNLALAEFPAGAPMREVVLNAEPAADGSIPNGTITLLAHIQPVA